MPRVSKASKRKTTKETEFPDSEDVFTRDASSPEMDVPPQSRTKIFSTRNLILLGILILVLALWKFRGYFIVATVNGQPISRWELNDQMTRRFGSQTLDNIVNERLILAAARQKGVFVTTDEINTKLKEIEDRLKGQISLKDAIAAQGMTEDMFRRQIEIQVSIEKMFDKDASVSAKDVDEFIEKNQEMYKDATEPAKLREEVTETLKQQKTGELFDTWFNEIKKNATINKYI